jgi:hypothetical protein
MFKWAEKRIYAENKAMAALDKAGIGYSFFDFPYTYTVGLLWALEIAFITDFECYNKMNEAKRKIIKKAMKGVK